VTEVTPRIERPEAGIPWTLRRQEAPGIARHWKQWWPAGLLLSAVIFALTYREAWSSHTSGVHLLFWLAAIVMVITMLGLVVAGPGRISGFVASLSLGLLLYLPKLLHSPLFFNYFDELAHYWTLHHLNEGAGLFIENPINKAVAFYPGLESVAGVLVSATGISEFAASNILIGALHALFAGALFLFYERVADSPRIALLSVIIYAANPGFVFFDSYFAYESFALPLAASAVAAAVLSERMSRRTAYGLLGVSLALCLGVVVSHHATAWVLAGLLLLLGLGAAWERGWAWSFAKRLVALGAITAAVVGVWLAFVAPYTLSYVGPTFAESADAVAGVATGDTESRELFYRSTEPLYEKYGSYLAVFILAGAFAYAVLVLMRRQATRREHLTTPLMIVGALYFLSLPIAFLVSNNAVTRMWEFAFLGVAPLVAVALSDLLATKRTVARVLAGVAVFIVFLGGIVSRTSLEQGLPGAYEPTADPRSMTLDVLAASDWLLENYGPDNPVIGDRAAFSVFGSYGSQQTLSGQNSGTQPWRVFFPRKITPRVLFELDDHDVRFLVIDRRITKLLPRIGWYYSDNEPGAGERQRPLPIARLQKFDHSRLFERIYDNGHILIYRYLPDPALSAGT
jgi:hypothetical protein